NRLQVPTATDDDKCALLRFRGLVWCGAQAADRHGLVDEVDEIPPCSGLGFADWLGEVIECSPFRGFNGVLCLFVPGHQDDRDMRIAVMKLIDHPETLELLLVRQVEVSHHHIEWFGLGPLDTFL